MEFDLLVLYKSAGDWTAEKVAGASSQLDAMTPCDGWNVRTLLNHMVDTQNYFASTARGEKGTFPAPTPPELIGDDPVAVFERARRHTQRLRGSWSSREDGFVTGDRVQRPVVAWMGSCESNGPGRDHARRPSGRWLPRH